MCSSHFKRDEMGTFVTLDPEGRISLKNVLLAFTAGVNEEQAWALCYQTIIQAQIVLSDAEYRGRVLIVTDIEHIQLHEDGSVHKSTFFKERQPGGPPRVHSSNECKIISNLVHVVYNALDYGMEEEAERVLTPELEHFLERMTDADETGSGPETDDEGFENEEDGNSYDQMPSRAFNFAALLKVCRDRLGSSPTSSSFSSSASMNSLNENASTSAADNHYKAVVRALVAETLMFSTFLQKMSQEKTFLREQSGGGGGEANGSSSEGDGAGLEGLNFSVWGRLWVQVIRDLRNGVKLKKVESFDRGPPIEYELTPYEILMDDIRSRRYKLKQVMVDGELPPRIKKDAHEFILEFIRGRPPLKKAAERVLPPLPSKPLLPIEALMESIRSQDPQNLRPTKTIVRSSLRKESFRHRPSRRNHSHEMTSDKSSSASSRTSSISSPIPAPSSCAAPDIISSSTVAPTPKARKTSAPSVITSAVPDQSSLQSQSTPQRRLIKADLDALYNTKDDDESDEDDAHNQQLQVTKDSDGTCYYGHICPDHTQSEPTTPWKMRTDIPDDHSENRRRHTICNPDEHGSLMITFPLDYTNSLNVYNSLNGPSISPILARRKQNLPRSVSKSALQEEFFQSNQWQSAMECLSLNLEEVVHIRNVLTKAELESLPVDCSTKDDVEKGKVCFLCLKSRFSLFGPWGNCCKLCKRMVCAKCCSKMRIPTEHFANIPVSTLSPLLSPTREEDSPTGTPGKSPSPIHSHSAGPAVGSVRGRKNSVGSAPTSPALSRKSDDSGQRSISPGLMEPDEARDRISPDGHSGPYSLPTVSSISLSLQALKRRSFGRKKDDGKTERLMGQLMVVCHDCKAMVLQIIRSSRSKKGLNLRTNMTLDIPQIHTMA